MLISAETYLRYSTAEIPHKSILVISQFPVPAWYDMFQDHTYAEACLARMLSGAYRLEMNGKNMRDMEPINK